MKAKAKWVSTRIWGLDDSASIESNNAPVHAKIADHLAACSCEMCRNPRRSRWSRNKGKTRKEIQAHRDLQEQTS